MNCAPEPLCIVVDHTAPAIVIRRAPRSSSRTPCSELKARLQVLRKAPVASELGLKCGIDVTWQRVRSRLGPASKQRFDDAFALRSRHEAIDEATNRCLESGGIDGLLVGREASTITKAVGLTVPALAHEISILIRGIVVSRAITAWCRTRGGVLTTVDGRIASQISFSSKVHATVDRHTTACRRVAIRRGAATCAARTSVIRPSRAGG